MAERGPGPGHSDVRGGGVWSRVAHVGPRAVATARRVERALVFCAHGAARAADGDRGAAHRIWRADGRHAVGAAVLGAAADDRLRSPNANCLSLDSSHVAGVRLL